MKSFTFGEIISENGEWVVLVKDSIENNGIKESTSKR
jgi:hypothetical protein